MNNHDNNPKYIQIRGARVHNLKNINVDIPLHQIVGICRCVRLREVVVGVGGVVCGGIQEVSGIAFYLYAKTYDGCGEGTGG